MDGDEARRQSTNRSEHPLERKTALRCLDVQSHRWRLHVYLPRPEGVWQPDVAQRGRGHSGGNDLRGTAASTAATAAGTGACARTTAGRSGAAAATAAATGVCPGGDPHAVD